MPGDGPVPLLPSVLAGVRGNLRRRLAKRVNSEVWSKRVVYLIIMFSVAAVGIAALWIQQKRERSHLESSERFLSSLQKISPDAKPVQRHARRRPAPQKGKHRSAARRATARRPSKAEIARREAARRRVEARRRAHAGASRSRVVS